MCVLLSITTTVIIVSSVDVFPYLLPLFLLLLDKLDHLAAPLLEHDQLLMLMLHVLLLLAVLGLELPQLLLLLAQLLVQLRDLLVVVALLVQGLERFFLLALHLQKRFVLVLDRLQDSLLVFQLVLQLDDPNEVIVRLLTFVYCMIPQAASSLPRSPSYRTESCSGSA